MLAIASEAYKKAMIGSARVYLPIVYSDPSASSIALIISP
jgi:hypothetical protein